MLRETHDSCLYQGGTESCQQERPALTLRNRTCLSHFSGPTSILCCVTTPNPTVCGIRNLWACPCCSLTLCPAFLAAPPHPAQNDLIPIWPQLPGLCSTRGQPEGWVTSPCDSGMMQGPAVPSHGVLVAGMMLQPPRTLTGGMTAEICLIQSLVSRFNQSFLCFNALSVFML